MQFYKKKLLSFFVLSTVSLLGCGGGSNSTNTSSTHENPTTTPETNNSLLNKDLQYGKFVLSNTGINSLNSLELTPFFNKSTTTFSANENEKNWNLTIASPDNEPGINKEIESLFTFSFDPNDSTKISSVYFFTNEAVIYCNENCENTYQYEISKEENGKTYFTFKANGQVLGSKKYQYEKKNEFSENARINGEVKFEINPIWPVFQTNNRFKVLSSKNNLEINNQKVELIGMNDTRDYRDTEILELLFKLNGKIQEIKFRSDKFYYYTEYQSSFTEDNLHIYQAKWDKDYILKINEDTGIQSLKFFENAFNSPFGFIAGPELKISGTFEREVPHGKVTTTNNEVFTIDSFLPYSKNQYKYFHFVNASEGINLNVRYDVVTKNINLAFQNPKTGFHSNLREKWNCQMINDNCAGITIDEHKGIIIFNNVTLIDGRKLNGELKNIGLSTIPKY